MTVDAHVTPTGLTSATAAERLKTDGPNVLPAARAPSPLLLLLRQMVHFFALMLWVAAGLAALGGMPQLSIAIVLVVILNGVFAFVQEYRADRAAARLSDLLPSRVAVVRDGMRQVIDANGLVLGDLVILAAGDRVCADLRVDDLDALSVDESMLTGESVPVKLRVGDTVHAGTFVVEGAGRGTVNGTAGQTRLASIAALTRSAQRPPSPLSAQIDKVVRIIGLVAIAVGVAFFGVMLLMGRPLNEGFLFAIGVTVALVPEGLLPTVTLSLARAAQRMAHKHALVRHLEAVETLGSTTFICTDKTGTLTENKMSVVTVWTAVGEVTVQGVGYDPEGRLHGSRQARETASELAASARTCVSGWSVESEGSWRAQGDPTEVALAVFAMRCGRGRDLAGKETRRFPFDPRRRRSSVLLDNTLHVLGAPDSVLGRCGPVSGAEAAVHAMSERGLRVMAVARREASTRLQDVDADTAERGLELLGLVGIQDPPRAGIADHIAACRRAGIKIAIITGDHPVTALAVARQVGVSHSAEKALTGPELPLDDAALGALLDHDGTVVARVTPEDKLRIARALQGRGHVVAMTGDGVNDGPALRQADIGVAMGATGTDVAREAADLVLLDDSFGTIVAAIELGRATSANIRRFLTYHLTDNVAELAPFVIWGLAAGHVPLAIGVLQILALDIGTDLLPALALGGEPPSRGTMKGPARTGSLVDRHLLVRALGVLGLAESLAVMSAFFGVLLLGGWRWGDTPAMDLMATASGTAFAAIVLGQLTNAYACRSESRLIPSVLRLHNPLLPAAVGLELLALVGFLAIPPLASLLGGAMPTLTGWLLAAAAIPVVVLVDSLYKSVHRRSARRVRGSAT